MNQEIETLYQDIGNEVLATAKGLAGRLLLYAEVEDGTVSADVIYEAVGSAALKFKFCPEGLRGKIYTLWKKWRGFPGNTEWRGFAFFLEEEKFRIELTYPEKINEEEDISERRTALIKSFFGGKTVDYSNPE